MDCAYRTSHPKRGPYHPKKANKKAKKSKTGCVWTILYLWVWVTPRGFIHFFVGNSQAKTPSSAKNCLLPPQEPPSKSPHPWGPEARGSEQHSVAWVPTKTSIRQSFKKPKRGWFVVLKQNTGKMEKKNKAGNTPVFLKGGEGGKGWTYDIIWWLTYGRCGRWTTWANGEGWGETDSFDCRGQSLFFHALKKTKLGNSTHN